jgi:signal transduction histidine kinase
MQLLESERAARDATFRTGALPTVTGDEALIGAVLRNLLLNGIRHGRPHGTLIEVSAERRDDTWRIAVASDGPAISEDDREALFRPRLRRPTSKPPRRTGIGLFICARIVARHGGQIGFERGPGEENVFVVTLPI